MTFDQPRRHPPAEPQTGHQFNHRKDWLAHLVTVNGWTFGAELGIRKGATFLHLLARCPVLTLIGVDLWEEQPDNEGPQKYMTGDHDECELAVRSQAYQFGPRAIIIKDWTIHAAEDVEDGSLDFVFVDADHSTNAVKADIVKWFPKLGPDGWMIGHDINWPEVREAVDKLLPGYIIGPDNTYARIKGAGLFRDTGCNTWHRSQLEPSC